MDELEGLAPFAYLPGEQVLGPAWAAAASGALPAARDMLVAAADAGEASGHRTMEAWLLHDACRLGQRGTGARLAELAEMCEGALDRGMGNATPRASTASERVELVAATDRLEAIGALLLAAETATEATHALQHDGDQRAARLDARPRVASGRRVRIARTPALVTTESPVPLTPREREICTLAASGATSPEIASKLFLSVRTVNNHLQRAYTKLGCQPTAATRDRARNDATPGRLTTAMWRDARACPPLREGAQRTEGPRRRAGDLDLAALVGQLDVEIDEVVAVVLALAGDDDLRGQLLAGPGLLREPDLEVAQVADADPVGDRPAEQSHREHAVAEHARQAGLLGLDLVVVHRVEVARRTRVHHEIGAGELVAHDRRFVTLVHILEEQLLLGHGRLPPRQPAYLTIVS